MVGFILVSNPLQASLGAEAQGVVEEGRMKRESNNALPLSKYEGTWVSMMCPAGWDIQEKPGALHIWGSSLISVTWREYGLKYFEPNLRAMWIGRTAEDRYKKNRIESHRDIHTMCGWRPRFEILREYCLGDVPVFEYQFWVEENACMINVQDASYTHPETCLYIRVSWTVTGLCSPAEWDQEMDFRGALFDTVMQSITFR